MANTYTQDVVLDADGKPVLDALKLVEKIFGDIQKTVSGIGVTTKEDAKAWQLALGQNLKMLRQAEADLKTLRSDTTARTKAFQDAEKQAKALARIEIAADKEANQQKAAEAKVRYRQREADAKQAAVVQKQTAKEVADYEIAQEKRAIAAAKELTAARREAGQAALMAGARGLTNPNDARAAKAASDARLNQLRTERERVASNDTAAARGIAERITLEKAFGVQLDQTIRKLESKASAERTAKTAADNRFSGQVASGTKLLATPDVIAKAAQLGTTGARSFYLNEQAAAQATLRATIASRVATDEQRVSAQRNLEIANARVSAAQRLVREEERIAAAEARQANAGGDGKGKIGNLLTPGYALTAVARTGIYGAAAGAAYGAFNAVQGSLSQVIEMEDELKKLQAIANATDIQLQELKGSIFDVGENSRFSVTELAKVSQTLAQAGVSSSQMEDVLKSVTTLATASGSTPDEAVQLLTSALGSFQLQGSEAARVADLMTSALNRTKLTVAQTGQAIQYVGATAFEQNIGLEQLLATVGAIAQAGVRSGSTIGTGFRQFLVDLQTPSEKLTTQLTALGITAADVNVSVRGLPAVLETLRDKGFGAAQAYSGLETRAAAFYLVAKNNIAVMDDLQMAFAQQGAAAIANERAMNSLTAQWTRFKNIVAEGFGDALEVPLRVAQDLLRRVSESILQARALNEMAAKARQEGPSAYGGKGQTGVDWLDYILNYDVAPLFVKMGNDAQTSFLNGFGLDKVLGVKGLGTVYNEWAGQMEGAGSASDDFATSVAKASEKVEEQTGKISEIDKEMGRLITQGKDLQGNTIRTTTETINLTARFEGLAKFLKNAKDGYGDLMQAMQQYRNESVKTQIAYLNQQRVVFDQQATGAKNNATTYANRALGNKELMSKLSSVEQSALLKPRVGANGSVLADAAVRTKDPTLQALVRELGTLAVATSQLNAATTMNNDMLAQNTKAGQSLGSRVASGKAQLSQLGSLSGSEQTALAASMTGVARGVISEVDRRLALAKPGDKGVATLQNYKLEANATIKGIEAAMAPTKKELAETKKAAQAAERESKKRPVVTQSDIDSVGIALGLKPGSGVRTKAEQNRLHAMGVTKATGDTSAHSTGGAARDFSVKGLNDEEAERMASTMRARYAKMGIEAYVKYERGGKNDGTGRHIHASVRAGSRFGKDREEQADARYNNSLNQARQQLDEENLSTQLKAVASATTAETFDAAVKAARDALSAVNANLEGDALDELSAAGFGKNDPEYQAKMKQVQRQAEQNVTDFNQKVTDAIIKSTKAQLDVAATAFEAAMAPSQAVLANAQAQSAGLDAFSLRNKVPDYVKQLANDRVARANEGVTRAEYAAAPAQIAAQQAAMARLSATIGGVGVDPEVVNAQLATMNVELQKMIANRAALGAQLGAGGLVPTSISEGLTQAIEAYRTANNLGRTFNEEIIMNLGGAIDFIGSSLTTMFTDIMTGTQSALGAFANFAKGIARYVQEMAAKIIASKILELLFKVAGSFIGPAASSFAAGNAAAGMITAFNGGLIDPPQGFARGGEVMNGSTNHDSVRAKLARGEFVQQKSAVDSVGPKFMAQLNQHGSKALDALQSVPQIDMKTMTETNVYVVPPDQKPTLGKNDVLVFMQDDMLNGESRKLIQHISREG